MKCLPCESFNCWTSFPERNLFLEPSQYVEPRGLQSVLKRKCLRTPRDERNTNKSPSSLFSQCKVFVEATEKWDEKSCQEVDAEDVIPQSGGSAIVDCICSAPGFIGVFLRIANGSDISLPQVIIRAYRTTSVHKASSSLRTMALNTHLLSSILKLAIQV